MNIGKKEKRDVVMACDLEGGMAGTYTNNLFEKSLFSFFLLLLLVFLLPSHASPAAYHPTSIDYFDRPIFPPLLE